MKNTIFTRSPIAAAIALATVPVSGILSFNASAQEAVDEPVRLEEVVVTATRRSESVMEIPINIAAVGSQEIEALRLTDIDKIARHVPGLTVVDRGPRNGAPDAFVRGLNTSSIGTAFSPDTVATYLGDVPMSVDFKPFDLERVEVLIGPQGTLYGQGTLGGAIRYIPRSADLNEFSSEVRVGVSKNGEASDFNTNAGLLLNVPLIPEVLAVRANVDFTKDAGFIDYGFVVREPGVSNPEPDFSNPADVAANLRRVEDVNDEDTVAARLNVRWAPTDSIEANLWYVYQDTNTQGRQINHEESFNTGRFEAGLRVLEPFEYKDEMAALTVSADLGWAEATGVIARSTFESGGQRDQTDLLLNFQYGYELFPSFTAFTREDTDAETDTIELRLASKSEGKLSWVAGYFRSEFQSDTISREFTPGFDQFAVDNLGGVQLRPDSLEYIQLGDNNSTEEAFFGELTWAFNDNFRATLGYRNYSFEVDNEGGFGLPLLETVFNGNSPTEIDSFIDLGRNQGEDSGDLFKLNVAWDINDSALVYATYTEGYRNGGVNSVPQCTAEQIGSTGQQLCAQPDEVFIDPDTTQNYEIGYKGSFLDNRASATTSLYYVDWTDLQVDTTTALGNLPITGNGSAAEAIGVEFKGQWQVSDNLYTALSYSYTKAELTARAPGLVGNLDALAGSRLPGSPEHQASFNMTYSTEMFGGEVDFGYGFTYNGDVYNGTGGPEDTLETAAGAPADRQFEALPSYDIHHLSATYIKDKWQVQLYIDNLFDDYYFTSVRSTRRFLQSEAAGPGRSVAGKTLRTYGRFPGTPQTIGMNFSYKF